MQDEPRYFCLDFGLQDGARLVARSRHPLDENQTGLVFHRVVEQASQGGVLVNVVRAVEREVVVAEDFLAGYLATGCFDGQAEVYQL